MVRRRALRRRLRGSPRGRELRGRGVLRGRGRRVLGSDWVGLLFGGGRGAGTRIFFGLGGE